MKISIGDEVISILNIKGIVTNIYIQHVQTYSPEIWIVINWSNGRISENTIDNIMSGCTFKTNVDVT